MIENVNLTESILNQKLSLELAAENYFKNNSKDMLESVVLSANNLIYYFIKLYGFHQSREDLYQAGVEGLLKALKRYDSQHGNSFTTYASSLIIGEIRHYIRKESKYYQPKTVKNIQTKMIDMIEEQYLIAGEAPSVEVIASTFNIKKNAVSEVLRFGLVPIEEIDLKQISNERYETFKLPIEDKILLEQAIKSLSVIQKRVVNMLFYKNMTQEQTAKVLGINQRKVSRLLHSSLKALRQLIT